MPSEHPTIQAAVDAATAGDEILVENGSYVETVSIVGRSDLRLVGESIDGVLVSHPLRGPTIDILSSSGIEVAFLTVTTELPGGDHPDNGGLRVHQSTGVALHHLVITGGAGNGIVVRASDLDVWNNIIAAMGDDGISFRGGMAGASRASIFNNTFADLRGGTGIGVWLDNDFTSLEIFDNIFANCDWGIYRWRAGIPLQHDFNVFWANVEHVAGTTLQPGEPVCDPAFVDAAGGDYHITAASCAVDAGVESFFGVDAASDDIDLEGRPAGASTDAGADELVGGCSDVVPPTLVLGPLETCFDSEAAAIAAALAAVEADDDSGGPVFLEASVSGPACDALVTVTGTDECGNESSVDQPVVIDAAAPSLAGVPADATLSCEAVPPPAAVTATDDCTALPALSFSETRIDGACEGEYRLLREWTAVDDCGLSSSAVQVLDIVDEEGPVVLGSPVAWGCLWPPNHGFVCFEATGLSGLEAVDACGSEPITWLLAGCASSQPEDDRGDGSTAPDCIVEDGGARLCFRVERQGGRLEGRDYSVLVVAVDACGNESEPTAAGLVHVPHDRRPPRGDCVGALGSERAGTR